MCQVREWWVIDVRSNQIVNCITTTGRPDPPSLAGMCDAEHLRLTETPTTEQLLSYKFYAERP